MWLAAEHGMFLRLTKGNWMTEMPENLHMDWVDSVKHVFEYCTERTPRSHFELRKTSLLWNFKYADIEFERLQARDMLQQGRSQMHQLMLSKVGGLLRSEQLASRRVRRLIAF